MSDDTVTRYMSEVGKCSGLPPSEEIASAKKIEAGLLLQGRIGPCTVKELAVIKAGKDAENYLVTANALLVVSIAKRLCGRGVAFADLIQEGNLGLMRAVRKFDWRRGNKFSTYATYWIYQAVSRAVADQSRVIRVPVHMSDRIRKVGATADRLTQKSGRRPSVGVLADEVGLSATKTEEALQFGIQTDSISIDEGRGQSGEADYHHFLEDDSPPVETGAEQSDLTEAINGILNTLDAREQRIIEMRFGLNGYGGRRYTLQEIGRRFGITRERVRQIEAEALGKLRHPRRTRKVKGFLE